MFTQYSFAQFSGCEPNEIRNVEGECVSAFDADEPAEIGMKVSVNAFEGSTIISVSGHTSMKNNPISILVSYPDGKAASVAQVTPDANGDFRTDIQGSRQLWYQNGLYTIDVKQGSSALYHMTFQVELVNGYTSATSLTQSTLQVTSFTVSTDKSSYNDGDTIRISGSVGTLNPNVAMSMMVVDPIGETALVAQASPSSDGGYSFTVIAGGTMQISGDYEIIVTYGFEKVTTTFYFVGTTTTPPTSPGIVDFTPPLLLTPSDMTVDASDSSGARVDYSVKAIDDNDGVLRPNCSPPSGSLFKIGETTVTCSATDNSGNSNRKSFLITVNSPDVIIPSWVKDVAEFWCGDEIDDTSFIEAIQYLINNEVIIVPTTASSGSGAQEIPNWVKSNACWWSQGLITNSDFASGLQYLIGQGIIKV